MDMCTTNLIVGGSVVFLALSILVAVSCAGAPSAWQAVRPVGPAKGPLRALPSNPRYFTDGTGRAIYLTGSLTWSNQNDQGTTDPPPVFDFDAYLDFLQVHNHNFIRLRRKELTQYSFTGLYDDQMVYVAGPHPWPRTGPGLALDGKPKFDLGKFDQAFFDRLRSRVIAARDRGIYVSVMFFDGNGPAGSKKPWCWDGHPFNVNNNINGIDGDPNKTGRGMDFDSLSVPAITPLQEAYVRKIVDTVNDLDNVLYEVANECHSVPRGCLEWEKHLVNYVHEYEAKKPKQHPVGITFLLRGTNDDLFDSPADWISPGGNDDTPGGYGGIDPDPPDAKGRKVVLNDTDHSFYYTRLQKVGLDGQRAWVWKNFMRGNSTLFMDPYLEYDSKRNKPKDGELDPYWETIRISMGYTRRYADRVNLAAMTPQGILSSSGYCLANTTAQEAELLVYVPRGPEVTVDLSAVSGTLAVEWFNPSTGEAIKGEPVTGGADFSMTAPFDGDAVLYMAQTTGRDRE